MPETDSRILRGKLPVNTKEGLVPRRHSIGATGLAQITELVWQMGERTKSFEIILLRRLQNLRYSLFMFIE